MVPQGVRKIEAGYALFCVYAAVPESAIVPNG
jgi:hypothetical protein